MRNHAREKHRVEPGHWTVESSYKTPGKSEEQVRRVVYLARISILTQISLSVDGTLEKYIHHPSTRIESPVSVFIVFGFLTVCHGN